MGDVIGINVVTGAVSKEVTKEADGSLTLHLQDGRVGACIRVCVRAYVFMRVRRWVHASVCRCLCASLPLPWCATKLCIVPNCTLLHPIKPNCMVSGSYTNHIYYIAPLFHSHIITHNKLYLHAHILSPHFLSTRTYSTYRRACLDWIVYSPPLAGTR